jgi:PAS domain S-box-containing protein
MIHWQFTPLTVPLVILSAAAIVMMVFMWQRRTGPGALAFAVLLAGLAEWTLAYALELGSADLAIQIIWAKFEYFGVLVIPTAWLVFTAQFTHHDKWLNRRTLTLFFIQPIIFLAFLWTTESHGLVWANIHTSLQDGVGILSVNHGMVFWLHTAYSYTLFIIGTFWLLSDQLHSSTIYRWQEILLIVGAAAPWIANILTLSGLVQTYDLTPFAFAVTAVTTGWALFGYGFLDVTPIAKDLVIASLQEVLFILDRENRIVEINPQAEALLGRSAVQVIGQPMNRLLVNRPDLLTRFEKVNEAHDEIQIGQDTHIRYFDLTIAPIRDRQTQFIGRVVLLRDISDRRMAERALQQANKILAERTQELETANIAAQDANRLKSEFLSTVSHELRTPFNAVMGFTDLLLSEAVGPLNERQRHFLERLATNNTRLLTLINDVLDLSRIEAGRMEFRSAPFAPRDILERVKDQTITLFAQKGLDYTLHIDPSLPDTVIGDADRVQQVLINLVGNAAKFTEQGHVDMTAKALDNDKWQIVVKDTGIGIASDKLKVIFEPFHQIDGSHTRKEGGTGLGLTIVHDLCQLMGGSICAESELGLGSTFTVELPIHTVVPVA